MNNNKINEIFFKKYYNKILDRGIYDFFILKEVDFLFFDELEEEFDFYKTYCETIKIEFAIYKKDKKIKYINFYDEGEIFYQSKIQDNYERYYRQYIDIETSFDCITILMSDIKDFYNYFSIE